jgi:hypothetical protein
MKKYIALSLCFILIALKGYGLISQENKTMSKFSKSPLENQLRQDMIKKNVWTSNCPVSLDRLNLLTLSYIDFDGNEHHDGQLIVHDIIADHALTIFKELYENKFPIASIKLIHEYNGDDDQSMEANNSSAFNCRTITNSNRPSLHSYGMAIDINPLQNPYLVTEYEAGKTNIPVQPSLGMEYVNRTNIRPGMVETILNNNSSVIGLFKDHGLSIWGGTWNYPIDWHHFQVTREQAVTISQLSYSQGVAFFEKIVSKKINLE